MLAYLKGENLPWTNSKLTKIMPLWMYHYNLCTQVAGGRVTVRSLCVQAVGSGLAALISDTSELEVCTR